MLTDVLTNEGMATLIALNGNQALTITQNFTPDIILLDAVMPGIDGFETARILSENKALTDVPIIFMTGLSDTENIVKGFESGGTDYITKPIVNQELIARMRSHFAKFQNTVNAKRALDTSGKHLFSSNETGEVLWATPYCQKILSELTNDIANRAQLIEKIGMVIQGGTHSRITARISVQDETHEMVYVGTSGKDEYLIQLIKLTEDGDIESLKATFNTTQRESEVLFWISKGKTNREIGLVLSMSPRTVNKHLEQIYRKLNVDNRTAAAGACITCLSNNS
jgi:DNA-binding NarL/FixJ family response regulator